MVDFNYMHPNWRNIAEQPKNRNFQIKKLNFRKNPNENVSYSMEAACAWRERLLFGAKSEVGLKEIEALRVVRWKAHEGVEGTEMVVALKSLDSIEREPTRMWFMENSAKREEAFKRV